VHYTGDVVVHDGSVYQARKDTGKEPGHQDWILLARAGRDGCDGRSPRLRGPFNVNEKYAQFDVVEYDGGSFVAIRDINPGTIPGEDGWQTMAKRGGKGPVGETGPQGRKGERGAPGEAAPTIVSWTLDLARYRAVPTMSNGKAGAPLELRGLFGQFLSEAVDSAVDGAIDAALKDAVRS
jgi:hypothetical protein